MDWPVTKELERKLTNQRQVDILIVLDGCTVILLVLRAMYWESHGEVPCDSDP